MTGSTRLNRRTVLAASTASLATETFGVSASGQMAAGALQQIMERHVAEGSMSGAVWAVHRDGGTEVGQAGSFERGGGAPMAPDTMFRVASITKPVTAALRGDPAVRAFVEMRVPSRRWGRPEEIASAVVFLAAPASGYVNGITLTVDGGLSAQM